MSAKANSANNESVLNTDETGGLGEIRILHPPGTFALTPASRIALKGIGKHQQRLFGTGIDWGSGAGCLAIAAAKIETVKRVIGLEISESNVEIARKNASFNGVGNKVESILSDSYTPYSEADRKRLETLLGRTEFIVANPPSSEGDDGFEYRRMVLQGARQYLVKEGIVFLSISYQYGQQRVEQLSKQIPGISYGGVLASTDWVPFDLQRPDLLHCLELYADEESQGGLKYDFRDPGATNSNMDAQTALMKYRRVGLSPLTRWQTHLFIHSDD